MAIQGDGRIVAAERANVSGTLFDFALARYNTGGALDTSFDADGKVTTDFAGGSDDLAASVAIQGDGRIVAAERANVSGTLFDFALARYNTGGALDTSFDADGKVTTDFAGDSPDEAFAVAVQGDGKIVAAGRTGVSGNSDFALARYLSQGVADLALTKTDPPGRVPTGRDMTYTLTVTNNGPDAASGVIVTDQLPPSVDLRLGDAEPGVVQPLERDGHLQPGDVGEWGHRHGYHRGQTDGGRDDHQYGIGHVVHSRS